ncbi:MAG: HD domain-containing protein [Campylobacteraceae bacterium]|jgi:putative hydrolase of HD superfamily|nr:HD domain-containing protein [Campylobacteraceae bacterium]
MISAQLIDKFFSAASIERWNDYPRMVELSELDKQAHKFIIAFFLSKEESGIDMPFLIEAGVFEFLRRIVVTDIRPDVFHQALKKKTKEINIWVLEKLKNSLEKIENGEFYKRFEQYLSDESLHAKERFILKAASYLATRWEFSIIYQTSKFLNDIEGVKNSVEEEMEEYLSLNGVRQIAFNKKLSRIVDLSGRLRFQKRWAQTQRIPKTSVLGHMLIVAILGYFYSLKIKACPKRVENNFFGALFHDLPEALTRDIISPVKYSVSGLDEIISEFEIQKIEKEIMPYIPYRIQNEFLYLLGIKEGKKDEFQNRIFQEGKLVTVNNLFDYNENSFSAIDGQILKKCDRLAAFIEAVISISYGIKSRELINGKESTKEKLKDNINSNVDFYKLADEIEEFYFN